MKKIKLFLLISFFLSELSAMNAYNDLEFNVLDSMLFKIASIFTRSDYLFLSNTDSIFLLNKKISLNINLDDIDKYYLRFIIKANSEPLYIYHTPLIEAVIQGNLNSVKLLLSYGADKNKKILTYLYDFEIAAESKNLPVCEIRRNVNRRLVLKVLDIESKVHYANISCVDLSKILLEEENEKSMILVRTQIKDLLTNTK